ncbi:hypothetical protein CARUB_v10015027mg [Capsella rubella]|uniref:Secreted protein n=1 Tax=Capsella rubella TaxID=81985 RepID=R0I1M9_9BRAS|nr:hypothetical protein CARUB_v10015027mg [Capsella rubella]
MGSISLHLFLRSWSNLHLHVVGAVVILLISQHRRDQELQIVSDDCAHNKVCFLILFSLRHCYNERSMIPRVTLDKGI